MYNSNVALSYSSTITYDEKVVYDMVSQAFRLLGLDAEQMGMPEWNPLGEYITPGDHVLIKPNLVMHNNPSGEGEECLYTQAPVIEAIIKYVVRALKGNGSIIVGDAPMQRCQFDVLVKESGYERMIERWRCQGIDITLRDFRNTISDVINGIVVEKELHENEAVVVDLGNKSSFEGLSERHIRNMRVTSYDPRILQKHHTLEKHEYLVAKDILDADVIINVPKPKTHRKAGMTGALKNLVGINCSKEYLPHHTRQSRDEQGDSFMHRNLLLRLVDEFADKKCMAEGEYQYRKAQLYRCAGGVMKRIGSKTAHEKYSEGSWYGNDTIWRTICDLNIILQYADQYGNICETRQRKFFNIGDMIVSGEKDGPVRPARKEAGVIIAGEDPCSFDEVVSALMGFSKEQIPTISHMREAAPQIYYDSEYEIISNNPIWNDKSFRDIYENSNLSFKPNPGWEDVL